MYSVARLSCYFKTSSLYWGQIFNPGEQEKPGFLAKLLEVTFFSTPREVETYLATHFLMTRNEKIIWKVLIGEGYVEFLP